MSNMTPFEIRLELLRMARDMLDAEYYGKREQISSQWHIDCESAKLRGEEPPKHPDFPPYPTEQEITAKAIALNGFVSNITTAEPSKTISKKST